jgi:nitrite reductase/ring-hydroxylating ferredoxin subunit
MRDTPSSIQSDGVAVVGATSVQPNRDITVDPRNSNFLVIRKPNTAGGFDMVRVDRWCPHKRGVDLLGGKLVAGSLLECPKHNWQFDIDNGGQCIGKSASINACKLPEAYQW